ncbi:DUF6415 family natural product biosynthesis protein [Streptomyces murinus]|uniref:DUF6415 family natural product biosynthesis protein n=1 Tax=Streptomyces murinus TaxID=33900 RepID=UPI00379EBBB9
MPNRTGRTTVPTEHDRRPVDILTMRATARQMLAEDAELPSAEQLDILTLRLRGLLIVLIPEVEEVASRWPDGDVPKMCARACIGESRMRLNLEPGATLPAGIAHAQRLARSVNALCDHYENLGRDHT